MEIFRYMEGYDYEQLVICQDRTAGLKAVICIHDTTLGPALGGTRMWPYEREEDAILDVLRLARGMTYKAAAAGLNLGGGKAVIIGDPRRDKSEALFRAFGRYVQSLNGRYITAEDVGTAVADMDYIRLETPHVTGSSAVVGASGDPSPITAFGVWKGMKAAAKAVWGTDSLKDRTVALQGVGHVGYHLAKHLHEEGATLLVTDIHSGNVARVVQEMGAKAVEPDAIYGVACDIYAPAALGATLNDATIPQLKCKLVAGPANNQLQEPRHGDMLHERGILYAPDYVINAGGLINVADELSGGYQRERAIRKVEIVYSNIERIIAIAQEQHIPTYQAADRLAEERLATLGRIKKNYIAAK